MSKKSRENDEPQDRKDANVQRSRGRNMTALRRAFSASVFCWNNGKFLLINHKLLKLWLPIGGEIEAGETPWMAAQRELLEETGLSTDVIFPNIAGAADGEPAGFVGYEEHPAGPKGMHMNFCFLALVPHRNIVSDGSWDQAQWLSLEQVEKASRTTLNVKHIVQRIHMLLRG